MFVKKKNSQYTHIYICLVNKYSNHITIVFSDAKFWVGAGDKPTPQGIRVADENGKEVPLRQYNQKTIVLTLPGDLTIFDIGHFGIWCEAFTVDFGHVSLPSVLNVPPSLKMLGVLPQVSKNYNCLGKER